MNSEDAIVLQKYSDHWPQLAANEIEMIRRFIPALSQLPIEHIGSTAVRGLAAKPIIDIAIEVLHIKEAWAAIEPLESLNYSYWRDNPDKKHLFFVKGLPPNGTGRTHHIHFFEPERFQEHLLFRDKLKENSKLATEYQKLKIELAQTFAHDREAYTHAKSHFIRQALGQCDTKKDQK